MNDAAWPTERLGDLCEKSTLTDPTKRPDDSFQYVDVSSISNETFQIIQTSTLLGKDAPSRARKQLRIGDVLFATVRPTLRRIAIVPEQLDGQVASTEYCVVRVNRDVAAPEFIFYWLLSEQVADRVENLQDGATYPAIRDSDLMGLELPLPPLEVQVAIARVLRNVRAARDARRRELDLERERKAALMAHLFAHGTRHEERVATELGLLPRSWRVVRIADISNLVSGGTPSKARQDYWVGLIPWVSPKDMKRPRLYDAEDHISEEAAREGSRIVPAGSVFVVIRGMILAKNLPLARAEVPMAFNQDMKAIIPLKGTNSNYMLYAMQHRKEDLYSAITSSAHGTKRLNTADIADMLLPYPPEAEQTELADAMAAAEAKIDAMSAEVALIDELFPALLEELMSGRQRTFVKGIDNFSSGSSLCLNT